MSVHLFANSPSVRSLLHGNSMQRQGNVENGSSNRKDGSVLAHSGMGGGGKGATYTSRLIGGATSGVFELFLFHPVDTTAKRLMSYKGKLITPGNVKQTTATINEVVFKEHANSTFFRKWKSMFPGLGFAAGYKIAQRTYKFGGQPFVQDFITNKHGEAFTALFGARTGRILASATAGSVMGVGEVILLPLDVLKIKAQTNPEVLKGRSWFDIVSKDGRSLYRGGTWTAARNAPGSFALFGGNSFVHNVIFGLEDPKQATVLQNFFGSVGGAVASITVAAPLDVIKTRLQNQGFDAKESGMRVLKNLLKEEGFMALFKGLTPKIVVVGPKLIFSMTVAQSMMNALMKVL